MKIYIGARIDGWVVTLKGEKGSTFAYESSLFAAIKEAVSAYWAKKA